MAGYSQTPLAKKLGIKPGSIIRLINAPDYYFELFTDLPNDIKMNTGGKKKKDIIHFFTKSTSELLTTLPALKKDITQKGMIWVSWPKQSSKIPTDVSESTIRDAALRIGLVDVKVCAVDEVWSGLKLVIPVKDRV